MAFFGARNSRTPDHGSLLQVSPRSPDISGVILWSPDEEAIRATHEPAGEVLEESIQRDGLVGGCVT